MEAPKGPKARDVTAAAIRVGVEIDVSDLAGRLEQEAMRLIMDLSQQGFTGEELASRVSAGLLDLSDAPIQQAARGASSESFNLGRNLAAQDNADAIQQVVRTEVLDQNTCPPCMNVDGATVTLNSDEYFRLMPPNLCDGRELCRGFYMYVS